MLLLEQRFLVLRDGKMSGVCWHLQGEWGEGFLWTTEVGCRDSPGSLRFLGTKGLQERRATRKISEILVKLKRELPWDCGSIEGRHGVACCLDTNQGLITSGWVTQVRAFEHQRRDALDDPAFFTDDVSNLPICTDGLSFNLARYRLTGLCFRG